MSRENLALSGDIFGCDNLGKRLQLLLEGRLEANVTLVGRGQGCCQISYIVQDSPHAQRIIQPNISVVLKLRHPGKVHGTKKAVSKHKF